MEKGKDKIIVTTVEDIRAVFKMALEDVKTGKLDYMSLDALEAYMTQPNILIHVHALAMMVTSVRTLCIDIKTGYVKCNTMDEALDIMIRRLHEREPYIKFCKDAGISLE